MHGWGGGGRACILLACMASGLAPSIGLAQPADALGTLLYSPEQRRAIELARTGLGSGAENLGSGAPGMAASGAAPAAAVNSSTIRLDGVVARARGKSTAWVNGDPIAQGTSRTTVIVGSEAVVDGHRLRVGQSFNKDTGTKSDVVAPGEVRKRLPP